MTVDSYLINRKKRNRFMIIYCISISFCSIILFTSVSGKNLAVPAVVESLVEAYQLVQVDEMEGEQSVVW